MSNCIFQGKCGKTGVRTIGQETKRICSGIRFYYLISYTFGNEAFKIEKQVVPHCQNCLNQIVWSRERERERERERDREREREHITKQTQFSFFYKSTRSYN